MKWLLKLYPPRWRRRYGAELSELIGAQPFTFAGVTDLLAGAVDAWTHPQLAVPSTSDPKGDVRMIAKILQFECAGYGPHVTASDKRKSAVVMIGGTLLLTLLWLAVLMQFKRNPYVMAIQPMTYLLPYVGGLHYTSLKARSGRTQAIFIAGLSMAVTSILLLAGWIASR